MQINNSTDLNFKAVYITPSALKAMSKRIPAGKFISIQESLERKYKTSPLDIFIDTMSEDCQRLYAKIKQNKSADCSKIISPEYIEESVFSSIFNHSEKFIEKVCGIIDQKEISILGKKSRGGRDLMV